MAGETLRSHLDLLLLATLSEAPAHGYAIIDALRARSGGRFDLPEGTVYPALHRLEQLGLLGSHWSAEAPRPRRVYALTAAGRAALRSRRQDWDTFVAAMAGVLDPSAAGGAAGSTAGGAPGPRPTGGVHGLSTDGRAGGSSTDGRAGGSSADAATGERHARP